MFEKTGPLRELVSMILQRCLTGGLQSGSDLLKLHLLSEGAYAGASPGNLVSCIISHA